MSTEWDETPWAGTPVKAETALVPVRPTTIKAVTGAGVTAYATDYPLSTLTQTPQQKAAAYLRAYKCGWFYKAESKISDDMARQPWSVSDGDIDSTDPDEVNLPRPDLDVPFESLDPIGQFMRLMERPNPSQTGRQLRQKTFIRKDMAGWTFWYLEAASPTSPITAIYGISPARLWPSYDKRSNELVGYILDYDKQGGSMTFEPWEIVPFSNSSADDDDIYGVGVVEAVYAELPLTDLMTRHTADLLSTGGRLAGMMWPKERALDEDEFNDAARAWRNVTSDPNSARRLLLFPEPMEWQAGSSTPAEIGIPELAELNRGNILTAFPVSPEVLGVSMPSGLNASGETRRVLYDFYWSDTIEPRSSAFDEVIQVRILSRYEALMGQTFKYTTELPDLDDASSLLEKAGAFKSLVGIGFDPKATIKAVGLDHIKWKGLPALLDPENQAQLAAQAPRQAGSGLSATVNDTSRQDNTQVSQTVVEKAVKTRDEVVDENDPRLRKFLRDQQERVIDGIRESMPRTKALRGEWAIKADPEWWNQKREDSLLREVLSNLYVQAARGSLQVVADVVDGIIPNRAVARIADDLAKTAGERITGINEHTLEAVQSNLAEGTRRGYSLNQLIDGVPDEEYHGLKALPVFDDARAETIARTETMLSYNRAALDAYGEFGVNEVLAYDGDQDEECAERNGQTFTIEEALAIDDHPNGTLDWAPVTEKAYHGEGAIKVAVSSPIINLHMPENVVNVPSPVINVKPTDVKVTMKPEMRIVGLPDRLTERKVERDQSGKITRTVDVETDA